MILPSMTYKEMYDHLAADKQKVDIKKEYLRSKAVKAFKNAKRFPAWELYEYKIPATNNQYIIYFYAENRACAEKPEVNSIYIVHNDEQRLLIQWIAGGYKHTPNQPISLIRQIHVYEQHFLERYNERFLKNSNLTVDEIACRFLSRNKNPIPIQVNEGINKNHKKYGKNGQQGYRVRDGVCFTRCYVDGVRSADGDREKDKIEAMYIIYKTYVSKLEMPDKQKIAVDTEHFTCMKRFVEDFQKQAKDGVITLKLER